MRHLTSLLLSFPRNIRNWQSVDNKSFNTKHCRLQMKLWIARLDCWTSKVPMFPPRVILYPMSPRITFLHRDVDRKSPRLSMRIRRHPVIRVWPAAATATGNVELAVVSGCQTASLWPWLRSLSPHKSSLWSSSTRRRDRKERTREGPHNRNVSIMIDQLAKNYILIQPVVGELKILKMFYCLALLYIDTVTRREVSVSK